MNTLDWVSVAGRSADRVIEEDDFLYARDIVEQELLDFRVVYAANLRIILELGLCTLDVLICIEGVVIKCELLLLTAQIVQSYFLPAIAPISLWDARKRLDVVMRR